MNQDFFEKLAIECRLGTLVTPVTGVPGGFQHKMFRLDTTSGPYACKVLNPEIMARPGASDNFDTAEGLETTLELAGLPVVAALSFDGKKRQLLDGIQFYLFPWVNGKSVLGSHITPTHCETAAALLARMHNIVPQPADEPFTEYYPTLCTDWESYIPQTEIACPELTTALRENLSLLHLAEEKQNQAVTALPAVLCISNGDMDPKNVLWTDDSPHLIDLECLDRDNPASHAIQLALQWSMADNHVLDTDKVIAFLRAYVREARWIGSPVDWPALLGLGYNWTDWAAYNLRRALGLCTDDPAERRMGVEQFRLAVRCIRTLHRAEPTLQELLENL